MSDTAFLEWAFRLGGLGLIVLAFVHVGFARWFRWSDELAQLSLLNQQLMRVHTFFVAFGVALSGVLNLVAADLLVSTRLGFLLCLGFALFWVVRLYFQFFVYSSQLWRGKRRETAAHCVLSAVWLGLCVLYSAGAICAWRLSTS